MTKIKITVLFLFLTVMVAFFAVSCTNRTENVLYYQRHAAVVTGTLSSDTGEFYLKITLSEYDPDVDSSDEENAAETPLRDAVIEFAYPEEIKGYTIKVIGGNVTVSICDVTVPLGNEASRRVCEIVRLFMIPEDALSSVSKNDDGGLTASFGSSERAYVRFEPSSSVPAEIGNENGMKFKTDGYFLE